MIPNKKLIYISISILTLVLIFPILLYIYYFRDYSIARDTSVWGTFGDFIGGILNPIISLASLIVLGYLTYIMSKQSNVESKKLFLLQQKMPAYNDLVKHFKGINLLTKNMGQFISNTELIEALPLEERAKYLISDISNLQRQFDVFDDFYYTIYHFNLNYGHLFKYDFDCDDFKTLLEEAKKLYNTVNTMRSNISLTNFGEKEFINQDLLSNFFNKAFLESLENFINSIRNELN